MLSHERQSGPHVHRFDVTWTSASHHCGAPFQTNKNTDTDTVAFYADARRAHYVLFPYFGAGNSDRNSSSIAAKLPNRATFLIYS